VKQEELQKPKKLKPLNSFFPRPYQLPILKALDDGYKHVLAILPRRAGKDITALNYMIRRMYEQPGVYYYIFPTYSQAKKVIWDSITNDGFRMLDYFPKDLVLQSNSQEMKIRMRTKCGSQSLFQLIGSERFDCYDDQTEILTDEGWKLFKNLSRHEKVATLNRKTKHYEWQKPTDYVEYDYEGDLCVGQNGSFDFAVTPNHRMWVKSAKGVSKFKRADDPTLQGYKIPSQCKWKGQSPQKILGYDSYSFVKLVGLFVSEGSVFKNHKAYRIQISQTKPTVRQEIKTVLEELGLNYTEHKNGYTIENKELYNYFSKFGLQRERKLPREILDLSKQHLHLLLEYMILGDGTRTKVYVAYFSTSKILIDQAQEIIIKLGLSGNIFTKHTPGYVSYIDGRKVVAKSDLYQITLRFSKYKHLSNSTVGPLIKKRFYKGKVYCVAVPNQIVKVRRNGKEIWCGNSLMGTNPQGCVFSEYALQDPMAYQYLRPILTANGGWSLVISTPRGRNHLWDLYQIASQSPQWFCIKLTVEDTSHILLTEIEREKEEGIMSEDMILQEYYTEFSKGVEGSYYARYLEDAHKQDRISCIPWDPDHKVHTAWDIGVRDKTCVLFFQVVGKSIHIIDAYSSSKVGLEHYVEILESKPYRYGKHIAPHDIRVKEWGSGTTRIERAHTLGIKFNIAPSVGLEDGIEAVRASFPKIYIDKTKCIDLIMALENYRQEYDGKRKVYKATPLHDWSSHYADCLRYLVISKKFYKEESSSAEELDKRYYAAKYGVQSNLPPIFQDTYPGFR